MKILSNWLRAYLPNLIVDDRQLAEDLTLRGIAVEGIFDLGAGNGSLFEMDITTNRVDAMNHYGVAREVATIYGLELAPIQVVLPAAKSSQKAFSVQIEAQDACGRFTARVLRGVTIAAGAAAGPLSKEVVRYFNLLEQKQILNAVDATNYAWLAMGQPTHAFDLDKLEGGIVVRRARKGEKLRTLDGVERQLDPEDLIVADHAKPLALAGVMGGWDSMITPETKNILVEAAWFDPVAVRRTARRHGLHTDASHRFERGADFNAAPVASAIVSAIILESGGHIEGDLVDVTVAALQARTATRKSVSLALSEVHRHLGTTIDAEGISASTVEGFLSALGCALVSDAAGNSASWQVTLPSWRLDLEREIDLIEEVARVYGYNRFANTLPAFAGAIRALPNVAAESVIRRKLLASGFYEAISSTFCSAQDAALTAPQPGLAVPVGNPLSEEAGMMRPSLVLGMLHMVAGNLHRDVEDVRLFEIGTVFSGTTERVEERPALSFGAAGAAPQAGPMQPGRSLDFYDVKGLVELILASFRTKSVIFDTFPAEVGITPAWLHPYRSARVSADGLTAGWFGQIHPKLAAERKLKATVFAGEIYLDRLFALPVAKPAVRELSRFQPVRRDFSFRVPSKLGWSQIDESLAALATKTIPELIDWRVREIRQEPGVADEYALLLGATFQAQDRTLRDQELQSWSAQVVDTVSALGARLRS
ncbi:phenylalanine--tRNA ligase subunit beta [Acidicapsa dinghuensis]|uniref:Phenylalanine--tRNA ligase beta subunit n=1 Tax=Acidicapsa dinghuensis TaxID=2218256 RepID=A0ABW1EE62_9BACT|nr:phenylalanine--tRNA ligase subunit beta [Acidicapsa dinghuensis]